MYGIRTAFARRALFFAALVLARQPVTQATGYSSIRCSSPPSAFHVPTYGYETPVFSACSEIEIASSIAKVYDAIIRFDQYSVWNQFVVQVRPVNGTLQDVHLYDEVVFTERGVLPLGIDYETKEIMTRLQWDDSSAMVSWKLNDNADGLLQHAEHVYLLTPTANGSIYQGRSMTRVVSYENFYGPLSYPTELFKHTLQDKFDFENRNLKDYVEGMDSSPIAA